MDRRTDRAPGKGAAGKRRRAVLALAALALPLLSACTAVNRQVKFNPPPPAVSGEGFGYPIEGSVSSPFGPRTLRGKKAVHQGVDFTGRMLITPVFAAKAGLVTVAAKSRSYGLWIEIQHVGGWISRYGHLSWRHVRQGQRVQRGDLIGRIGSSGRSTGTHLHFEVRHNGQPVDPFSVLPAGGPRSPVPRVEAEPAAARPVATAPAASPK